MYSGEFTPNLDVFNIKKELTELGLVNDWSIGFASFMYGINFSDRKENLKPNKDLKKLVFFTRPQLNMRTENLVRSEATQKLLHNNPSGLDNYVRHMLDPRLEITEPTIGLPPYLDNENPFIPPFTNGLTSLTGWMDVETPTTTSTEGRLGEQHTMLDGDNNMFNSGTLNATFKSIEGNPISKIITGWQDVATSSKVGPGMPYFDIVLADELEYTTRIYVIVLGEYDNRIKHICCTGSAIIKSNPIGKRYDITGTNMLNDNKEETYNIVYDGLEYDDVRIANDFNKTVEMFNSKIKNDMTGNYYKVNPETTPELRSRAIPYINEDTMELEWLVPKAYLKEGN